MADRGGGGLTLSLLVVIPFWFGVWWLLWKTGVVGVSPAEGLTWVGHQIGNLIKYLMEDK